MAADLVNMAPKHMSKMAKSGTRTGEHDQMAEHKVAETGIAVAEAKKLMERLMASLAMDEEYHPGKPP